MTLFSLSGLKAKMRETRSLSVYSQTHIKETGRDRDEERQFCPGGHRNRMNLEERKIDESMGGNTR